VIDYKLKDFQVTGIAYHMEHHYSIIGDAMGLGKTLQAIEVIKLILEENPKAIVIVACPATLRDTWVEEFEKFSNIKPEIFKRAPKHRNFQVAIVSYGSLKHMRALFRIATAVVGDEIHYAKNIEAARTEYLHEYIEYYKPERFLGLSGTAIKNRVTEFYSLLLLCSYNPKGTSGIDIRKHFANFWEFANYFCNVSRFKIHGRWVVKFEGHKNIPELKQLMEGKYIRRKASEVLNLPGIIRKDIIINDEKIDKDLLAAWNEGKKAFATMKMNSAKIKTAHTGRYVKELLDQGEGPVVIFSDHVEPAEILGQSCKKYKAGIITGDTPMKERHRLKVAFQAGELDILSGTYGVLSEGYTLTRARNTVLNDLPHVPGVLSQAEKRIHRMSQERNCIIHRLFWGKFDAQIGRNLTKKIKTLVEVL